MCRSWPSGACMRVMPRESRSRVVFPCPRTPPQPAESAGSRLAPTSSGYAQRSRRRCSMESIHTVVARFLEPTDAREAMIDLEMKGIDADAIHLLPTRSAAIANPHTLDADIELG